MKGLQVEVPGVRIKCIVSESKMRKVEVLEEKEGGSDHEGVLGWVGLCEERGAIHQPSLATVSAVPTITNLKQQQRQPRGYPS